MAKACLLERGTATLATAIIQDIFAEDLLSQATAIRDLLERLREKASIAAVEAAKKRAGRLRDC